MERALIRYGGSVARGTRERLIVVHPSGVPRHPLSSGGTRHYLSVGMMMRPSLSSAMSAASNDWRRAS